MSLGFEHIQDVRPECLSSFHDKRTSGIALAANVEARGRSIHRDAGFDQSVDELGCGQEVGLIRWNYESARVTFVGCVQKLEILQGQSAVLTPESLRRISCRWCVPCGRRSSSLALGSRACCLRHFFRNYRLDLGDVMGCYGPRILAAPLD